MEREWQKWDLGDTAETTERVWQGGFNHAAHRDTLVDLVSSYLTDPPPRVLEVGCGTGLIYKRLVPALLPNRNYVGVDVSDKMLEIARRNFPSGNFLHGDGYELQFEDEAFDLVICFEVLGHVPDTDVFVRELLRVTRHTCIFTVWPGDCDDVVDIGEDIGTTRFLHRQYSDAYIQRIVAAARPGVADRLRVAVLAAEVWAYIVSMTADDRLLPPQRVFPFPGYLSRLLHRAEEERVTQVRLLTDDLAAAETKLARLEPAARALADQLEGRRNSRLARWWTRFVPPRDLRDDIGSAFQQLVDDSVLFSPDLQRFRLGASRNLQRVPFVSYPLQPRRPNLCGVWLAPILDVPPSDGLLGVELVSPSDQIVVHSVVSFKDVDDDVPTLIGFAPIAASDRGVFQLRVFVRDVAYPVRLLEWRKYRYGGFGRLQTHAFCGLVFEGDDEPSRGE